MMADPLQVIGALSITATFLFICFLLSLWKRRPTIHSLQNKHVLITGGSSGIGLEIAKQALAQGSYVTLISRNLSNLQKASDEILKETGCEKDRINVKVADVKDYEAISAAINESFLWMPIDLLVCNAGIVGVSYLERQSIEWIDDIVGTNLTGTLYTLRAALPFMKQRSYRHPLAIVLMGSLGSLYPLYGGGVYTSTKYAIKGLAEALRLELLPLNIGVTLVCPGFVETPLLNKMEDSVDDPLLAEVAMKVGFYDRTQAGDPREVAKATLKAAQRGNFLVASGWKGWMLSELSAGILPAETFAMAVFDLFALIPARLTGYFIIAYVYIVIWLNHRTKAILVDVAKNEVYATSNPLLQAMSGLKTNGHKSLVS